MVRLVAPVNGYRMYSYMLSRIVIENQLFQAHIFF